MEWEDEGQNLEIVEMLPVWTYLGPQERDGPYLPKMYVSLLGHPQTGEEGKVKGKKKSDIMKVGRIVSSKNLHAKKLASLTHIAKLLGEIRAEAWRRYGSIAGIGRSFFDIRNEWVKSGREFLVPARLWQETLHDVLSDIDASREAAKQQIHRPIFQRTERIGKGQNWTKDQVEEERKRLFTLLKYDHWMEDSYLRRMMRKYWKHGKTTVDNQIKLTSEDYKWFLQGGQGWLKVQSLEPGKRIAIPLASNHPITGTIRIIVKDDHVEVHHTIEAPKGRPCGTQTLGIDKGYTEAFVDSDGDQHGVGLGKLLTSYSDACSLKYKRRNKIQAIAEKSSPEKKARILANNLGKEKLDHQKAAHQKRVADLCYKAVHSVVDKAKVIAAEDLTAVIKRKNNKFGKVMTRRLNSWTKGTLATALQNVSHRRGSTVHLVNCAYTSQVHSQCRCLGTRTGDVLYCGVCKDVAPSDREAAREILARLHDPEISRWTPYQKVKSILQERTSCYRLRLSNQDSSCIPLSTESELPATRALVKSE